MQGHWKKKEMAKMCLENLKTPIAANQASGEVFIEKVKMNKIYTTRRIKDTVARP